MENPYITFCNDPANSMNCDSCPYNINATRPESVLPCGQFICWVDLTGIRNEDEESES